jgi:NAD dependent epimerase/dehydratase
VRGRRVLVTGGGGFIGSHVVEHLVGAGARVAVLLRYNSRADLGALEWSWARTDIEPIFGDLRDAESVEGAAGGAEVVIHLGAQVSIPYSYVNARDFVETNVVGTLNLLTAARRTEPSTVIVLSTSEVYGTPRTVPITEDHPLVGQSPYAASKIAADAMAEAFHRSYAVPVGTVRPFNTYGPRQSARAVIPTIVTQALVGDDIQLGSLDPVRDFTYVTDTAAGIIAMAACPDAPGRTIQLGTGQPQRIGDVVSIVESIIGRPLSVHADPDRIRPEDSEVAQLLSDPRRAREMLDWEPSVAFEQGLELTIEYVREHLQRYRPGVLVK